MNKAMAGFVAIWVVLVTGMLGWFMIAMIDNMSVLGPFSLLLYVTFYGLIVFGAYKAVRVCVNVLLKG